jgi:hypothetical protein
MITAEARRPRNRPAAILQQPQLLPRSQMHLREIARRTSIKSAFFCNFSWLVFVIFSLFRKCLPETCTIKEEKKSTACVNYCSNDAHKEKPECKVDCEVAENEFLGPCVAKTCEKEEKKVGFVLFYGKFWVAFVVE